MNIFWVLSQGASRLHEPSMSAFLGYLLDSNHDHGLGDTFLRAFLNQLDPVTFAPILARPQINAVSELEQKYTLGNGTRNLDIEVSILDDKEEIFRIIIENKIRSAAANPKQLVDYYAAVLEDEPTIRNLYVVFLTPNVNTTTLSVEFSNLKVAAKNQHYAKHIYWDSPEGGVLPILRSIMEREMIGDINPINEYMRHTLKAFIRHASTITQTGMPRSLRTVGDIGEVTDEVIITLRNGRSFRVIMRDSTQIQVFDNETGEKQVARHILAEFIDENKLPIPHEKLNTRGIGKQFFRLQSTPHT